MTVPVWPGELRQWMSAPDFSTAAPESRLRSPTEVGPPKVRGLVSLAPQPVTGLIRCTQSQLARLDTFWMEDTAKGTLPFVFPDQVYNNAVALMSDGSPFESDDGQQVEVEGWWVVTFGPPYTKRPLQRSRVWAVTLSLNIMP